MKLTFIDWTIMVIYFVFVLGIGFALKRYMKKSTDFWSKKPGPIHLDTCAPLQTNRP
jgi:Na+/proline symporter